MRLAASSAFDILTKEGRAAVATYNFIDGRDDPRTRSKEQSWQHLLQVEAKRSVRFKDKFAFTIGPDGVKWYHCDVPGCEYKTKYGEALDQLAALFSVVNINSNSLTLSSPQLATSRATSRANTTSASRASRASSGAAATCPAAPTRPSEVRRSNSSQRHPPSST